MNCALFQWASAQRGITPHLSGVLLRLIPLMDEDGNISMPQKEIAPLISVGERQTRAGIAALVDAGVLIRKRRGGVGAGRVADMLSANLARNATGDTPPLSAQPAAEANCDNGGMSPQATGDNAQPAMGGKSPLSASGDNAASSPLSGAPPVDNLLAHIEHAPARADSNLKLSRLELIPETVRLAETAAVLVPANSDRPPPPAWQRVCDAVGSRWLDPNKSMQLALEGALVQRLIDAGADEHLDVIPTVARLCETNGAPISSWKYFTKAIREAAARRKAAEAQQTPITAEEANAYEQPSRASAAHAGRGQRRSRLSQRYHELIAEDQPLDLGRVDSIRIG